MTEGQSCCATKKACCTPNVGKVDRVIRAAIGGALLTLVFTGPHTLWGLLGLPLIGSAIMGKCGLYSVMGINTMSSCCAKKGEETTTEAPKSSGGCCGGHGHHHDAAPTA